MQVLSVYTANALAMQPLAAEAGAAEEPDADGDEEMLPAPQKNYRLKGKQAATAGERVDTTKCGPPDFPEAAASADGKLQPLAKAVS